MELNDFITNVANQFDDTDISVFTANTKYKDLDEWSSLNALAILNMIDKKYGIRLIPAEMRATSTLQELYDLVNSKR